MSILDKKEFKDAVDASKKESDIKIRMSDKELRKQLYNLIEDQRAFKLISQLIEDKIIENSKKMSENLELGII